MTDVRSTFLEWILIFGISQSQTHSSVHSSWISLGLFPWENNPILSRGKEKFLEIPREIFKIFLIMRRRIIPTISRCFLIDFFHTKQSTVLML